MNAHLEQFSDATVSFALVHEREECVIDGSANEGAKGEEFAVHAMQRRLSI